MLLHEHRIALEGYFLPIDMESSGIGTERSRRDIYEGGFTGPIMSNNPDYLPRPEC